MVRDTNTSKRIQRPFLWVLLAVFIFSSVVQLINPLIPYAAAAPANDASKQPNDWFPKTYASRWTLMNGLKACVREANGISGIGDNWNSRVFGTTVSADDVSSGEWFSSGPGSLLDIKKSASYLISGVEDSGRTDCNEIVKATSTAYSMNNIQLFCALGGTRDDGSPCVESGSGARLNPPSGSGNMDVSSVWGTASLPGQPSGPALYEIGMAALMNERGCNLKAGTDGTGDFGYKIKIVDAQGNVSEKNFTGKKHSESVRVYTNTALAEVSNNCAALATLVSNNAAAYAAWAKDHSETPPDDASEGTDASTTCAADGIGWIICPISRGVASLIGLMYDVLTFFLQVPPLSTSTNDALYKGWATMRNIANVIFVIVFILIIYSQITGGGKR